MSTPITVTPPGSQTIDLSTSGGSVSAGGVFSVDGLLGREGLARVQAIGDINDDAFGDFLIQGTTSAYILLGPVKLDSIQTIDLVTAILVDTASLGQPADRMGDINGDGLGDLIFLNNATKVVTIIYGRADLPRTLRSADAAEGRGAVLSGVNLGGAVTVGNLNASAIQWNQDGKADLLLTAATLSRTAIGGSTIFGYLFSGDQIRQAVAATVLTPLATFSQDPLTSTTFSSVVSTLSGISGITGQSLTTPPLIARVVGDVNGDGLEAIVFADPGFSSNLPGSISVDSFGRAYLFLGRTNSAAALKLSQASEPHPGFTAADAVWQGFGLGASVTSLGDIGGPAARLHAFYNDGYDDFAITRNAEDSQYAFGSVLGFFGDPDIGAQAVPQSATTAAALVISQAAAGQLPAGTSLRGTLYVAASDFDGDGMPDLAIGQPDSQVVVKSGARSRDQIGRAHV